LNVEILANRNHYHGQLKNHLIKLFFCRSVSPENIDMSLLKSIDDFIQFFGASYDLKMPVAIKLSFDLLQTQINPKDVWYVLGCLGSNIEQRSVCNKVNTPE
jgi:hypothetical protein